MYALVFVCASPVSPTNVVRQVPRAYRHHYGRRHAHSLRPAPQRGDRLPHTAIGHHVQGAETNEPLSISRGYKVQRQHFTA